MLRGIFTTVAMVTTAGLRNAQLAVWLNFLPVLLMEVAWVGGCASSTSSGIKVMRFMMARRKGMRALLNLIHPKAVAPMSIGHECLSENVVHSMRGFIAEFSMLYSLLIFVFMASGADIRAAFACITA